MLALAFFAFLHGLTASAALPYHGVETRGAILYASIAYAKPPVGVLRWRRSVPFPGAHQRKESVSCPQMLVDTMPNESPPLPMDEDCLYLNVWAPKTPGPHPVIFFIHGGALITGSGLKKFYDGSVFARQGVVFVAINYRLGELGYGPKLETQKGSLGLLDQSLALEWASKNVAYFGGDPKRIYLMGQSKGAEASVALLETGLAGDRARGAIAFSGPRHFAPENNRYLPAEQLAFYPGQAAKSYEALLSERGFRLYVPETPSLRGNGAPGPRYRVLITSIHGENHSLDLLCYNLRFARGAYDYIDSYLYVLHPGTIDHGAELRSLFAEDPYGGKLRDLITRFVSEGTPPLDPPPFREKPLAYHLYPRFSLSEATEGVNDSVEECLKKPRSTLDSWRFAAVERVLPFFGGLSTVPDFKPPAILPKIKAPPPLARRIHEGAE